MSDEKMPVTYEYDRESEVIHARCTGDVTFDEVIGDFRGEAGRWLASIRVLGR